ncbi:MAG TPA: hypothetical protein VFE05_06685 [Longimicrobiaceae bacterium]|nr:hypothetical protein [Longimicrobiaceae bacterium]
MVAAERERVAELELALLLIRDADNEKLEVWIRHRVNCDPVWDLSTAHDRIQALCRLALGETRDGTLFERRS